ncbi:MAG TPA: dTDP-4-dehydrorhamnose 3,5-epimerase family protein [Ilumatobacter sp.]
MDAWAQPLCGAPISGVRLSPIRVHEDDRGSFAEYFASHRNHDIDPVQWSVVTSSAGVLRGMHLHIRHDEYIGVVSGRVTVGLHDLRVDSPTHGRGATYELCGSSPAALVFPRGVVHGWLFHEPTVHLQGVSEAYDHYGADDNHGCHWSDPELGIEWPFEPTTLSERAAGFGSLADLRARVSGASLDRPAT